MAEVKFEIQKQIGEILSSTKEWTKEVNLVSRSIFRDIIEFERLFVLKPK